MASFLQRNDPMPLSSSQIEEGAQKLFAMAQRPRRKGGVGPLQRQLLTLDRCRNSIKAVEAEGMEGFALMDRKSPRFAAEREALTNRAAERAKSMESGSIIAILVTLLPLLMPLLKALIEMWIKSRLSEGEGE